MNVLVTADQLRRPVPGGIGTYVRSLTVALAARTDIDPTLWIPSAGFRRNEGLKDLIVPARVSRLSQRFLTQAWDRGLCKTPEGFAVVHAASLAVPPKSKTPMTVMVHDLGWRSFPDAYPDRGRAWHEASLKRAIERSRMLFVPSTSTANDLIADGVKSSRIEVIPLGSDHLPQPDEKRAIKRLRKLKVSDRFFLAVGTMEPRKNLPGLITAYQQFRDRVSTELDLLIVGPAGWGDAVPSAPGVKVVSSASLGEVTALYRQCFAFVSVPFLEGFGLPVLEAMAQGAPVISSPVPSAGDATYLVDPNNTAAITEALSRVVRDENLRSDLVERGKRHADRHTWADTARLHAHAWMQLPL